MAKKLYIAYTDAYLGWQLGAGHPTNPVRAQPATELLQHDLGEKALVVDPLTEITKAEIEAALKSIHDHTYVDRFLAGYNSVWYGCQPEVAEAGLAMFAGTMAATKAILSGKAKVAFNPQGAKHHAKFNSGLGFCALNDMAWAAIEFQKAGLRPLYIDWDIHAGDGVYHMLKGKGVPCISIHNGQIFPNDAEMNSDQFEFHNPELLAYNFNLKHGDGDSEFRGAINAARAIIEQYQPDVILLAAGADGHTGANNLGLDNHYTSEGYFYAARMISEMAFKFAKQRVLIGGAGGYQPIKETPETWALVASTIFQPPKGGN